MHELIESALVPVLQDRLQAARTTEERRQAILGMRVCDPASGSGHFLLAAARRLARELAQVETGEAEPSPDAYRTALRQVIRECLYAVDKNPLAVDLCKVALWIEGHNAGVALGFLDQHIRCGDSLVGVLDPDVVGWLKRGIPDGAYTAVTGDDKKAAAGFKRRNKQERQLGQQGERQSGMRFDGETDEVTLADVAPDFATLGGLDDRTPADVADKQSLYEELRAPGTPWHRLKTACDLWTAAASWLTDQWLRDAIAEAPKAFNVAFNRWRELYIAATWQRDEARRIIDRPSRRTSKSEREDAGQREKQTLREIDLLLNRGETEETDFYPYRYLASEGFLPGYNFPRLPLRALVESHGEVRSIERNRFYGLIEFGPHNVIYHEGRKHRISACVVPAGGFEARIFAAKLCHACGYVHPREHATVDVCEHCGTRLDASTSDFPQALFEQTSVRAVRWTRITADEEERSREGYEVTTHYRFDPGEAPQRLLVRAADDAEHRLLEVTYAPQAELWRINRGWRRSTTRDGFALDPQNGRWAPNKNDDIDPDSTDPGAQGPLRGIMPTVTDSRNVMLIRPVFANPDPSFLVSLAYALQRGIQVTYQVEEREIEVELIGEGEHQRILLWEAAEGGTGVWERLTQEPNGFARVAREALRICHFDPETGEADPSWTERCAAACYDCLLSYSNQLQQRLIDRYTVRDFLLALTSSETVAATAGRDYDEHYHWLCERIDPASRPEREFIDHLYQHRLRLPDHAQYRPTDEVHTQPDFYYERDGLPGICVYVDGPAHDVEINARHDRESRESLEDLGYRIITIRYDRPIDDQIAAHSDIFGVG